MARDRTRCAGRRSRRRRGRRGGRRRWPAARVQRSRRRLRAARRRADQPQLPRRHRRRRTSSSPGSRAPRARCSRSIASRSSRTRRIAASVGVGPAGRRVRAGRRASWSSNGSTGGPSPTPTSTTRAQLARIAAAAATLHAGPRFASDFDMFDVQRRYLDDRARSRFPAARGLSRLRAAGATASSRRCGRLDRHRALPQRPARREHHRRRRAAVAHRLRVLRQQRPVLRARQHLERGGARPRPARAPGDRVLRRAVARPDRPRPAVRR